MRAVLYSWHVPVFFFLSGYLWGSKRRTLRGEIRARADSLMKPYVFWLAVIWVFFAAIELSRGTFSIADVVVPAYGGGTATRPFSTFWFVSALFFTSLLMRFLERFPSAALWLVAAIGLAAGTFGGRYLALTPLSIGIALSCLFFLVVGQACRKIDFDPRVQLPVGVALIALGISSALLGFTRPLDIKAGDFGTPLFSVIVSIAVSWGLVLVANSTVAPLPKAMQSAITTVSVAGFVVVLLHPLFLYVLDTPDVGTGIDFTVALLGSWAIGIAALYSPVSRYATGHSRRRLRRGTA